MITMKETLEELNKLPLRKIIAIKIWYTLGLFTLIYLGVLVYDLVVGLNPASESSALIVIVIASGLSVIDMALLWTERLTPAMLIMVLWISPLYVLYKLFKNAELLNLSLTDLPKRVKQYTTASPFIKTVHS